MTYEEIKSLVGEHEFLCSEIDEDGREVLTVEHADARTSVLREELDGSVTGPCSNEWQLDERGAPRTTVRELRWLVAEAEAEEGEES